MRMATTELRFGQLATNKMDRWDRCGTVAAASPNNSVVPGRGADAHDDQIALTDSQLLQDGLFGVGVRVGRSSQGHAKSVAKSAALRWIASFVVPLPPQLVLKLGAMPCRRDGRPLLAANNTVIEPRLARQGQGDLGTSRTTSATILTEEIDSIVPRNSDVISRCSGWAASFSVTPRRARSRGHSLSRVPAIKCPITAG